jgi:hypothetical protein
LRGFSPALKSGDESPQSTVHALLAVGLLLQEYALPLP